MNKVIMLLCVLLSLAPSVSAQKNGFKTIGDIREVSSRLGVEMIVDTEVRFENGGSSVKIIYKSFGDSPAPGMIPLDAKISDGIMTEEIRHDIDAGLVPTSNASIKGRLGGWRIVR